MLVKILVLHGPNLNMLGQREEEHYGKQTLESINDSIQTKGREHGIDIVCNQSNSESELVTWIQEAKDNFDGILINPAAYTHTSVAIRDALIAVDIPTIEVHLSNPHARESFRHRSLIEDVVVGRIMGFRGTSYLLALDGLIEYLQTQNKTD